MRLDWISLSLSGLIKETTMKKNLLIGTLYPLALVLLFTSAFQNNSNGEKQMVIIREAGFRYLITDANGNVAVSNFEFEKGMSLQDRQEKMVTTLHEKLNENIKKGYGIVSTFSDANGLTFVLEKEL